MFIIMRLNGPKYFIDNCSSGVYARVMYKCFDWHSTPRSRRRHHCWQTLKFHKIIEVLPYPLFFHEYARKEYSALAYRSGLKWQLTLERDTKRTIIIIIITNVVHSYCVLILYYRIPKCNKVEIGDKCLGLSGACISVLVQFTG